ncbi:DUF4494 domain-containing protein [Prevotella sp. E2-28]|uniref:DUF4494 domain-containing protein n=1 Tax=Prevotella sp. E2-28 TaxID=2913620 RepID=UPI001ED9EDF4|nr:DUF4494 domain-containing protein [Prevotella sp. E2-28]UKK52689.1 DUF4494 domain-containing protein [Prevotella sp. E2-28]
MKTVSGTFKECIITLEKVMEDGSQKKVSEKYVVDAITFGEAETKITEEMASYVSGEFGVDNINPCKFREIFVSDKDTDDTWYIARLAFIVLDEKTDKEKKSRVHYLVQGCSVNDAMKSIDEVMGKTMIDYVIEKVEETKYVDVFTHNSSK